MGNRTLRKYAKGSLVALLAVGLALAGSPGLSLAAPGDVERIQPSSNYTDCITGSPSMSDDGRYVVLGCQSGRIVLIDRVGGTTNLIHENNNSGKKVTLPISVTPDGRYILFATNATNLDPRDTDSLTDTYVFDRIAETAELVSVNSEGVKANQHTGPTGITADGRLVVFQSTATNLVPGTNGLQHIFVKDLGTGDVHLVSVDSTGDQLANHSFDPFMTPDGRYVSFTHTRSTSQDDILIYDFNAGVTQNLTSGQNVRSGASVISGSGRYVAFESWSSNLVPNDTNGHRDVFLYDRETDAVQLVSTDSTGQQANLDSESATISSDGRYVVFTSRANNLVPNDTNGEAWDVFRKDLTTGQTELVSSNAEGVVGNAGSTSPSVYQNGRYVLFWSDASNLVPGDANGVRDVFLKELSVPDTTNPIIDYELSPASNASGWNNSDVTVTFTCEDAESGIASCTEPVTVSTEGEGQTVTGTAVDNAGNSASVDAVVNIDKTAPTTTTPTMSGLVLGILLGSTTDISATVGDNLSGVVRAEYYFDTDPGQGNGTAMNLSANPTNGTATATADVSGLGGGQHTLYVRAQDDAGNWSVVASRTFLRLF